MYDLHYATVVNYIHTGLFGIVRKTPGRTGKLLISQKNLETFDKNLMVWTKIKLIGYLL